MIGWLIDTLLVTGGLIALVLVLRRPVSRHFGPGMAYALWLLPMLRLLLPPLVLPASLAPTPQITEIVLSDTAFAATNTPMLTEPTFDFALAFFTVWLGGAVLFLLWRVVSYRLMRRRLLADAREVGDIGDVRLIEVSSLSAPLAFGVFDKVIALPIGFIDTVDRAARDLAIAHELQHHAGRDLAVNFAVQPLLALHWFNPLAWAGWRALRRDQEAACDARVLAGRDGEARAAYGRLIASFARGPNFALAAPMACPVLGEKSIIHRLRSLTMSEPTPRRRQLGRFLIGVAALALPLTATISYAANEQPAPPLPPSAPAAPAAPEAPEAPDAPEVRRETIVIRHDGKDGATVNIVGDEANMHTRTITRDGKTIVIKTHKPLSDVEFEAKMVDIDIDESAIEEEINATTDGKQVRRIVIRKHGDGSAPHAMAFAGNDEGCTDVDRTASASASSAADGRRQNVRVRICSKGEIMAHALEGVRRARREIAQDASLSAEIKANVLRQLDAEIERLSKEG